MAETSRVKRLPRGRPSGRFTQHRRIDKLRELLEKNPRGITSTTWQRR